MVREQRGNLITWALGAVLCLLTLAVMWRPVQEIVRIARTDDNSSYVIAVPFLAIALAWVRRRWIRQVPRSGFWVGPLLLLLGLGLYLASYPLQADSLWYASPVVAIFGVIGTVWGVHVLRAAGPALGMLLFAIPVPAIAEHLISVPLQTIASVATVEVLNTAGVPVLRSGNLLTINGHQVNVAEACSGMRSTFALLVLIYTFVFLQRFRWSVRAGLLIFAPVIAVVCNIFRLVPVTLAHGYGSQSFADALHDYLGFVIFAVAVLLCLGVVSALRWAGVRVSQGPMAAAALRSMGTRLPGLWGRSALAWGCTAVSVAALLATSFLIYSPARASEAQAYHARVSEAVADLPLQLNDWEGTPVPLTAPAQEMLKPNAVYSVRFAQPRTGRQFNASLIHCRYARDMGYHEPRVCYPNSGWQSGPLTPREWRVGDTTVQSTEFVFHQVLGQRLVQLRVVNLFVLPEGTILPLANGVNDRSKLPWIDSFGVAQVQLVFDASFSEDERRALVQAFLTQSWDAIRVIQSGIQA